MASSPTTYCVLIVCTHEIELDVPEFAAIG